MAESLEGRTRTTAKSNVCGRARNLPKRGQVERWPNTVGYAVKACQGQTLCYER